MQVSRLVIIVIKIIFIVILNICEAASSRLSIVAYTSLSFFQVYNSTNNSTCLFNQYNNVQIISVSTNLQLKPVNNSLVKLIFTKVILQSQHELNQGLNLY
jgi:hypothetical protein